MESLLYSNKVKKILVLIATAFLLFKGFDMKAQDPQFSQFYAAPLYLNPALTGGAERGRVGVNYRNQWPDLNHSFTTTSAYVDWYSKAYESGFGLIVTEHAESFLDYRSTEVAALYSYNLQLAQGLRLRTGFQLSYISKDLNFDDLVFGNQIDIVNGQVVGPSGETFEKGLRVNMASVSAGGLLYSNNAWLGVSVHHINQPNQSFVDDESRLQRKYSLHTGFKINFKKGRRLRTVSYQFQERSATFALNYKKQGPFNQLDAGVQLYFQPLVIGAWYRGIPVQSVDRIIKNESIIGLVGIEVNSQLSFGYSYDFTVSRLAGNTGGAHEVSLTFEFGKIKKRTRRDTRLPCFKY
jgi:type IX secretion system PorP/SprF family membrane protein